MISFAEKYPDLVKEWHPTKNGNKTPYNVSYGSGYKAWWFLPYDDPRTGKRFYFEWQMEVERRTRGGGCPYLSGKRVWTGYNDLATHYPELAKEWHPTKNGNKTPYNVSCGSAYKAWWLKEYEDPKTGKTFQFVWQMEVGHRSKGDGCPYLSGKQVWPGYNDLATNYPELAKEWHPTKNGDKTPYNVSYGSGYRAWWIKEHKDPKTGKIFHFVWQAAIQQRIHQKECPYLSGKQVWPGYNDLKTHYPELATQWHPTKNGDLTPDKVAPKSNKKVWWLYPYDDPLTGKHFDFEWEATPASRINNPGCPFLSNQRRWVGYNDFKTRFPELASQWNYELNEKKPEEYMPNSRKEVWWKYPYDDPLTGKHFDFVWKSRITNRVQDGSGCPFLSGNAIYAGFNDLATKRPDLAEEWDYDKNRLGPDEVTLYSNTKRWWKCPRCGKSWYAAPSKRACGQECSCNLRK